MEPEESGFLDRVGTLLRFMLPAIFALFGLMLYLSGAYKTREDFADQVLSYAKADNAARVDIRTRRPMIEKVAVELGATAREESVTREDLSSRLDRLMISHVVETIIMMSLMVLLPFGIMGSGLIRHGGRESRRHATKGFGMKLMMGLLLAFGWQYILNPLGITGTTLSTLVRYRGATSKSTAPTYLNMGPTEIGTPNQRMRFEEEGIDGISTLAAADIDTMTIPEAVVSRAQLVHWQEIARLAAVIGVDRWKAVSGVAMTASEFLCVRATDAETRFVEKLNGVGITNVEEIRRLLR